jgi:carbonic anhydrase/acetyltransferase-like protein (isoleucine patch superfamily)
MRCLTEIQKDNLPIIILGSCLSLPTIIESCVALDRKIIGIVDNDYYGQDNMAGLPVFQESWLDSIDTSLYEFFVATIWSPGSHNATRRNNDKRNHYIDLMDQKKLVGATIIHPTCVVSPGALVGRNVRIGAMTVIIHGAEINNHVLVKEQCYISHDVKIGKNSVVQIKACITGHVCVGENTYIGVGSTIMNRGELSNPTIIGSNVLVHPGLLVIQDLPNDAVASLKNKKYSRVF